MGLIAIGDVHGCRAPLEQLLDKLAPDEEDTLVFVGDYIDRGPDSKGVIDRLLKLRREVDCVFLRGNHEAMMLDYLDNGEWRLWRMNGGASTLESYSGEGQTEIPDDHIQFVRDTKLYHETEEFVFVHAGLKPDRSVRENLRVADERVLLWERGHLRVNDLPWEKTVVCGHTPQPQPINRSNLICIDTGCVYNQHMGAAHLTAIRLPERELIQVACLS